MRRCRCVVEESKTRPDLTSIILNESVSVGPWWSSPTSTSDSFNPSSFRDRPGCGMYCWFNLWPPSWPFCCCCVNAALLYSCTPANCLRTVPDDNQLILAEGSSLSISCSGSGETTWVFKSDDVPFFQTEAKSGGLNYKIVQSNRTTSVLTLWHVNWKYTGVYQCKDLLTKEIKEVAIFVPGEALFCYSFHDFEMLPEPFYKLSNPNVTFYDLLPGGPFKSIIMKLGETLIWETDNCTWWCFSNWLHLHFSFTEHT